MSFRWLPSSQELHIRGIINKEQSVTLHQLRCAKMHYRSGTPQYVSRYDVDNALRAVEAALKLDLSAVQGQLPQVARDHSKSVSAYASMRNIEAELISIPNRVMRTPEAAHIRSNLLRMIRDPHAYLWSFLHKSNLVEGDLLRLRSFY